MARERPTVEEEGSMGAIDSNLNHPRVVDVEMACVAVTAGVERAFEV